MLGGREGGTIICFWLQSAGPQKESKRDKKAKGKKKKVFDSTQSSNPKLKYRQKERVSVTLPDQTHKQKEPIIVAILDVVVKKQRPELMEAPVKLGEEPVELREESGEELREESEEGSVELGEEEPLEEVVEEAGGSVEETGRTNEQVDGGLEQSGLEQSGSGLTGGEIGGSVPEETSDIVAGVSGDVAGVSDGVVDNVAGVSAAAVESDEEEKAALLGEENLRQMEEAEKVRDGWILVLIPDHYFYDCRSN